MGFRRKLGRHAWMPVASSPAPAMRHLTGPVRRAGPQYSVRGRVGQPRHKPDSLFADRGDDHDAYRGQVCD